MAVVPLSGTDIRILSGIPFHNDYKHTRWFTSRTQQTSWFYARNIVHRVEQSNFQREENYSYINVNKHIESLFGANYIMFRNAEFSDKWFYGFITKLEYRQKNNTRIHFELDVMQTWMFDMDFKPSYVVREHCRLWNSDGTPVINTVDEGLSHGSDYDTVDTINYRPMGDYKYLVVVSKTPIHTTDNKPQPNILGIVQPLSYYIVPFKYNGVSPTVVLNTTSGTVATVKDVLSEIYDNEQAVNNIVSLYITDNVGLNNTVSGDTLTITTSPNAIIDFVQLEGLNIMRLTVMSEFYQRETTLRADKYSAFNNVSESKLLMYPYTQIILDDFQGNRMVYKPEYIKSKALQVKTKGSLGTSNYVSYGIENYNSETNNHVTQTDNEYALINNTPNDVPIITDMLSAFLQGNRNSIQNQKASIMWNGTMNAVSSGMSMGVASAKGDLMGATGMGVNALKGAGNTVLQIEGIQAKQDDISNIPPSISKMGGNTPYTYGNRYNGVYVIFKQIKPEYRKKLTDFFNMYGYKVNEVKVPNFRTRQNWNYIQTLSCTINGSFNNEDLQELKQVFDNGITLWHTDDIGNYSLANEVR